MIFTRLLNKRLSFLLLPFLLLILLSGCGSSNSQGQEKNSKTAVPIGITVSTCRVPSCNESVAGARPFINTWNNIHLFQSFDYKIENPAAIAKYYDFVWGVSPDKVAAFRSYNSNIFLSYYLPFHRDAGTFANSQSGKYHNLAYWKSFHADWVLYRCDRVTPAFEYNDPNMPLDFANPAVVNWQVQNYAEPASKNGYDAIAADNVDLKNFYGACGVYINGEWQQRYTGQPDDPQWRADIIQWLTRMQQALHALSHPLALIPNLALEQLSPSDPQVQQIVDHVDGVLDEDGFTRSARGYLTDNDWLQRIQFIEDVQAHHKPYYIENQFPSQSIDSVQVQWALASYLMSKEQTEAIAISTYQGYGADVRYDEYNAQIGSPHSTIYKWQNVYWRDYSNGISIVNPSSTETYTVTLKTANHYINLYGNHVSQKITLPPHSGSVLLLSS